MRKYNRMHVYEIRVEQSRDILLSSIRAQQVDVSVQEFEPVKDEAGNPYFKVDFE